MMTFGDETGAALTTVREAGGDVRHAVIEMALLPRRGGDALCLASVVETFGVETVRCGGDAEDFLVESLVVCGLDVLARPVRALDLHATPLVRTLARAGGTVALTGRCVRWRWKLDWRRLLSLRPWRAFRLRVLRVALSGTSAPSYRGSPR